MRHWLTQVIDISEQTLKERWAYTDATRRQRYLFNANCKNKTLKRSGHMDDSKRINKNDIILGVILYPKKYWMNKNEYEIKWKTSVSLILLSK